MLMGVAAGQVVGILMIQDLDACTDKFTVYASSVDGFPFVGAVPNRNGHFVAAGFAGHGTCCLREIECIAKLTYLC
jgi:hypothetical protein